MSEEPKFMFSLELAELLLHIPKEQGTAIVWAIQKDFIANLERLAPVRDGGSQRYALLDRLRQARRRELLPPDWQELRAQVFERDGYRCVYCGDKSDTLHCDHRTPLSRSGSNEMDNLATACAACNISKGAKTVEEWGGRR